MWLPEPRAGSGSLDCPDLQDVQHLSSPSTPLYFSFFEEERRAVAASLRLGAAVESSPGPGALSGLRPRPAGPTTSTPLPLPSCGRVRDSSAGGCEVAAAPGPAPAPKEPGCLPQPPPRRARRGSRQRSGGGPGCPARGRARLALPRTRASPGPQLPAAGTGRGARETRPPAAAKVGSPKQPSSRLSTEIPTVASRSSLRPPEKMIPSKRFCLNKGINDQTWVCAESSLSRELAPGLTSGCEDTVPAEQSAGDQLSQELKHVKKELEQAKGELADKIAQCAAYQQTISSLQAQLRAADRNLSERCSSVQRW